MRLSRDPSRARDDNAAERGGRGDAIIYRRKMRVSGAFDANFTGQHAFIMMDRYYRTAPIVGDGELGNQTSRLIFPAKPDYIVALRLAAAAVGNKAGLNIDEIDHLMLLTSQAFNLLMLEGSKHIEADITENGGSLEISFSAVEYHDGQVETESRNVLKKALLKSLTRKCCMIHKGRIVACVAAGALGDSDMRTYGRLV